MQIIIPVGFLVFLFVGSAHANCTYSFDVDQSVVEGTGYKFTEKEGVTAVFEGVSLNNTKSVANKKDLLKDLVVTVDLLSIDSENALRDRNMRETLFANITNDSKVTVRVKKVGEKTMETEINLNNKTQPVTFDYQWTAKGIEAKGVFDALKYALGDQIAALKKTCGSLHTGADGKSVTWTDFDLSVKAVIKETCQ
jgi:polyisoprenoid-binding protein YceI